MHRPTLPPASYLPAASPRTDSSLYSVHVGLAFPPLPLLSLPGSVTRLRAPSRSTLPRSPSDRRHSPTSLLPQPTQPAWPRAPLGLPAAVTLPLRWPPPSCPSGSV